MEHYVIEVLLFALIVFNQIVHNQERKMLINRILARNFPELQTFERNPEPKPERDRTTFEL